MKVDFKRYLNDREVEDEGVPLVKDGVDKRVWVDDSFGFISF